MCRRYSDAISPTVILDAQTRNNKHIDQRVRKFRTLCSATVSIFVGGMFPLARIIEPAPDLNVFCRLSTVSHADVNAVGAGGIETLRAAPQFSNASSAQPHPSRCSMSIFSDGQVERHDDAGDRTEDHRDEQDRVVVHARGLARRDD